MIPYHGTELTLDLDHAVQDMIQLCGKASLTGAALAAVGGSICCIGPLVLLLLGIGGSWIGRLTALEPYRPLFISSTVAFVGLAFHRLYLVPRRCAPGTACADPRVVRRQRLIFWTVAPLLIALLAAPWLALFFS